MSAVFSHGRLRLYLLTLLAEGPRHGYELIRLLENRFLGLYAPSAGTIYPRLARLAAEGLVTHTAAGGRKVYEISEAGRAELRARAAEVTELESEIRAAVEDLAGLADEIQDGVRGSVRDIKRELRQAARETSRPGRAGSQFSASFAFLAGDEGRSLEGRIAEFTGELRRLVNRRLAEEEVRAVTDALDTALRAIRNALR